MAAPQVSLVHGGNDALERVLSFKLKS